MTNKHWTLIGASYAVFALVTFMAAVEESHPIIADQPCLMAKADKVPLICGQRLYQSNPRRDLFLTIWTTYNCAPCEQQKAEIPILEKAGYNVVLRTVPAPRWIKSFPTTVVTRDRLNGERVTVFSGFKTLAEIDAILQVREEEEEEVDEEEEEDVEEEDYDIFSPKGQSLWKPLLRPAWKPEWYKLYVHENVVRKQAGEIEILHDMGFKIEIMDGVGDGKYPCAVLAYMRGPGDPYIVKTWWGPFTSKDILNILNEVRPPLQDVETQVNALNLVVWLDDSEESDRQYDEIAKLRKLGFSANVYVVGGPKKPPRHVTNFPTVILIDNRKGTIVVWSHFVDANTIRLTSQGRT